ISRWVIKLVVGIALAGFILFEAGSPIVTGVMLDGQASDAATDAAKDYFSGHNVNSAQAIAQQDANTDGAKLVSFTIDQQGTVHVTLSKQAKSYVLQNFGPTKNWYTVTRSASAVPTQ
ncbi:MAG: hypothetical protein JO148_14115, partial [Acidimicrobiia bacterium]|nr:hypothetical protein [Acidimicrobiia bacterium]